ncbi:RDD family protein [Myroides sp. DW712]|uniref:RDD family protein n=1 Tax=Myroides sp. DW712 TaxID=3389800 RepID=UPI00397C2A51
MTALEFIKSSKKRRIAAFLIDHFVITFLIVTILFLFFGESLINGNNTEQIIPILLSALVPGIIFYFAKDSYQGMSIGKWIMGIRVRDEENFNEVPSFSRLFLRNLFLIIWPIEFIILAINIQKKRLGDKVAKTVVLKNPLKSSKVSRIMALISVGMLFFLFVFFIVGSTMKKSDAYKTAIKEIEKNEQLKNEIGTVMNYGMLPTGNISINNGYGQALLEIKAIGVRQTVKVLVYLEKEPESEWRLVEMQKEDGTVLYLYNTL